MNGRKTILEGEVPKGKKEEKSCSFSSFAACFRCVPMIENIFFSRSRVLFYLFVLGFRASLNPPAPPSPPLKLGAGRKTDELRDRCGTYGALFPRARNWFIFTIASEREDLKSFTV